MGTYVSSLIHFGGNLGLAEELERRSKEEAAELAEYHHPGVLLELSWDAEPDQ
jgi:hypothetical protein